MSQKISHHLYRTVWCPRAIRENDAREVNERYYVGGRRLAILTAAVEESFSFSVIDFLYCARRIARFLSGFALRHLRVRTA